MNKEVVQYIGDAKAHGLAEQEIKQNLLDAGWDAATVEESFSHLKAEETKPSSTMEFGKDISPVSTGDHAKPTAAAHEPAPVSMEPQSGISMNPESRGPVLGTEQPVVSDSHFAETAKPKRNLLWLWVMVGVAVLALLGVGYFAYAKYFAFPPKKVWDKFITTYKPSVVSSNFTVRYSDPNELKDSEDTLGTSFPLKNIFVELKGKAYLDVTELEHPNSDTDFQYTFGSGNTNVSTGFSVRQIDQDTYFKVGDNPFLASMVESVAQKKYDWVKLNGKDLLDALQKDSTDKNKNQLDELKKLGEKIQKSIEAGTYITMESSVGEETVNGVKTIHYKASVDKGELKKIANTTVDDFVTWYNEAVPDDKAKDDDITVLKEAVAKMVDKYQVKEFDLWVGKTDNKLYKLHYLSNMPSFISLIKVGLGDTRAKADDAKRIADLRQLSSAFELYNDDNDGYPDGANGIPNGLTPVYIGSLPTPPTTIGTACNEYYNSYWYQPTGQKVTKKGKTVYTSFELTSCIGSETGGYEAGVIKLTPSGMIHVECAEATCPAKTSTAGTLEQKRKDMEDALQKIEFSAELKLDADYTDYDKKHKVEAPSEFWNMNQYLDNYMKQSSTSQTMNAFRF